MDYKDTLNLPKTAFKMKANLVQREPEFLKRWEEMRIYERLLEERKDASKYILHDGPPYANGHIHIGHALNKILKDFVVKSRSMMGYAAPYVPGWDCHGLPIEHQVDKELGEKKRQMTKDQIRKICRKYAERYVNIQRKEFKRLGVFGDWDNPYITMDFKYEADIVRELGKIFEKGYAYRGLKPVYWCIHCVTALAEAEVEYGEHTSTSIYVKFPCRDDFSKAIPELSGVDKPVFVLIWTTTPWTLPANLAVAMHPEFNYVAVDVGDEVWILAEGLADECLNKFGVEGKVLGRAKGKDFEGLKCSHPFEPRDSVIILADFVTLVQGTGCVHIAPGHGEEDYQIGLKYGLEVYNPVDDNGNFDSTVSYFKGENIWSANPKIVELLREKGYLIMEEEISHSYPHCWRCKNPVIFRATPQWFISMDKNGLRQRILDEIKRVKWIPSWGEVRIREMVSQRPDWCISRQRAWGVPITVLYCKECGRLIADRELFERVAELTEQEGADVWFTKDASEFLPEGYRCPDCGCSEFVKETDILDVWFDSGVSHAAVLERREELSWPADLYLEGSDQHRGWFQSSLIESVATREKAPYKGVLTHGFVVDGQGRKMSKSLGNVISPQDVIKKYGAEILRLWVAAEDYTEDVRLSDEILKRLVESYRKIRNTIRFMLANLYDFDPEKDALELSKLMEMDRWILTKFSVLAEKVMKAYEDFLFHRVYHLTLQFCNVELSAVYLDVVKERLYIHGATSYERRSAQTAIYYMVKNLIKLLAPVLSFTMEDAWEHLPKTKGDRESIHLELFTDKGELFRDEEVEKRWDRLYEVRKEVTKALELARSRDVIRHPFDAKLVIYADGALYEFLKGFDPWVLREFFIVSQVELKSGGKGEYEGEDVKGLSITVERAEGEKCPRCWVYSTDVGSDSDYPDVCARCAKVLKNG